MVLKERNVRDREWIHLGLNRKQWWALVNMAMILPVP
jgi:hypothetical protein